MLGLIVNICKMGYKNNSVPMRASLEFRKMMEKVKIERLKLGKDKKPINISRITLALTRIPELDKRLIESDFKLE